MIWYFIRASIFVTLCGLAAGHCCADEIVPKKPVIHLPTIPVIVEPDERDDRPVPPPPVNPITTVATLAEDTWYVIESDVPLIVLHSPAGLVGISEEVGPVKVRGKFADGTGKIETRVFKSQCLYFVNAVKAGKTELIVVPVGVSAEADIIRQPLTVMGLAPIPPPDPKPDPDPEPPAPLPGDSNRVLIVYESSELSRLPASQAVLMSSASVRDFLNRKCSKGPTGEPERRIWDKDVDMKNVEQSWRDAMAIPRTSLPWLIVSNGKTGFSGPLPANETELIATLKKYLGE